MTCLLITALALLALYLAWYAITLHTENGEKQCAINELLKERNTWVDEATRLRLRLSARGKPIVYVAHKSCGDLANAHRAEWLTAWLNEKINGAIFVCPWLPMVRHWEDLGETRKRGMQLNFDHIKRCDALIALSPLVMGTKDDWDEAKTKALFDLSDYHPDSIPDSIIVEIQKWVDGLGAF